MVRLQLGRAESLGALYLANGAVADGLRGFAIAQRGRAEERHLGFLCGLENAQGVREIAGNGLVNEHRLARREHGLKLLPMHPAIVGFEKDDICKTPNVVAKICDELRKSGKAFDRLDQIIQRVDRLTV